jgi:hypothetical protein
MSDETAAEVQFTPMVIKLYCLQQMDPEHYFSLLLLKVSSKGTFT